MAKENLEDMKAFKLRKLAKELGIDASIKKKDDLIAAIEEAREGGKKSKGKSKTKKADKGKKGAKGKKAKEVEADEEEEAPAAPKKKTKKSKASKEKEPTIAEIMALLTVLRTDVDDLSESTAARFDALEGDGDEDEEEAEGEEDDDDEDDEALDEARKVLKKHLNKEGDLDIKKGAIKKFKKAELAALATFLSVPYPEEGLAKVRAILAEAYEAAASEDDDDDDDDGDEEELIQTEDEDGEQLLVRPYEAEILTKKFWGKKGPGHGQKACILCEGDAVVATFKKAGKDDEDDPFAVFESDNGDKYQVFLVGESDDEDDASVLGLIVEDDED